MSRTFFAHALRADDSAADRRPLYDRYIVPTPGKVYWDGVVAAGGKIRWDNPDRAPLLLIGGGIDRIAAVEDDQGDVRQAEAGAVDDRAEDLSRPLALDLRRARLGGGGRRRARLGGRTRTLRTTSAP